MSEQKPFHRLDFLAQCLLSILTEMEDRKPCSFYVTRAQIDHLVNDPTVEVSSPYLVQLQRVLLEKGAAFISLPSGEKNTYYVCYSSDPMFSKAATVGENLIKRVTKTLAMDLDTIRALADYGLPAAELARATCASIGHSGIAIARNSTKPGKPDYVCLRCARKVKSSPVSLTKSKFNGLPSAIETGLQSLTWRDTVNLPSAKMDEFAIALNAFSHSSAHQKIIVDPDALAMVPSITAAPAKSKSPDKAPKLGPSASKAGKSKKEKSSKTKKTKTKPAGELLNAADSSKAKQDNPKKSRKKS